MRNLKKFLALVMAFVMAMSLMVTANAAYYTNKVDEFGDVDTVTEEFEEAVGVLTGMEIFQGDEKGFRPGDSITRAEVAALIYRAATGDVSNVRADMYRTYAPFTDVNSGDWFAGYVGYCWNAGYIKGTTATTFNPYAQVTGYEVLAMILRAAGYDQQNEFTGSNWIINVASLSTQLHVVDDVKATVYGDTLHGAARRDVVASLLFRAIRPSDDFEVNIVDWTPALGYQHKDFVGNGPQSQTLGEVWFGMKEVTGIVVGNQDTGETKTRINESLVSDHPEYAYFHQTANGGSETTKSTTIDAKTGLDLFGHKVHAWYGTNAKTFWMEDLVKKTALVAPTAGYGNANDPDIENGAKLSDSNASDALLGLAAQNEGFDVNLGSSKAVFNRSFGISTTANYAQTGRVSSTKVYDEQNTNDAYYPLYLLISNNDKLTVDFVVEVTAVVSRITKTDNVSKFTSITLPSGVDNNNTNTREFNTHKEDKIATAALTGESDKTLGTPVVAIAVTGTNTAQMSTDPVATVDINMVMDGINGTPADGDNAATDFTPSTSYGMDARQQQVSALGVGYSQPGNSPLSDYQNNHDTTLANTVSSWYHMRKPTSTVTGVVTAYSYNWNTNDDISNHSGSITINGQVIERSPLADAIANYDPTPFTVDSTNTGRGIKRPEEGVNLSATAEVYTTYTAYLDNDGKYIWLEPNFDRTFVYGTYIDYTTALASSSYEYTMVGVDANGKQVVQKVTSLNGQNIVSSGKLGGTPYEEIGRILSNDSSYDELVVPYRDSSSSTAGVMKGSYVGFTTDANGALMSVGDYDIGTLGWAVGVGFGASGERYNAFGDDDTDTRIDTTDVRVGMAKTENGADSSETYYITEDTKIIAVSGAGTDTQKITIYKGMTELLDGAAAVTIRNTGVPTGAISSALADGEDAWEDGSTERTYAEMMYYTTSDYTYASTVGRNKQIDTLILPAEALSWEGKSGLYYVGNPTNTSYISNGTEMFYRYSMYLNGELQNVWLTNTPGRTDDNTDPTYNLNKDTFYALRDTGKSTPTGETVYSAYNGESGAAFAYDGIPAPDYSANNNRPTAAKPFIIGTDNSSATQWATYFARTYADQTATLTYGDQSSQAISVNYRVAGAKVVNLNNASAIGATTAGLVWPGITDLATLNDAGSLGYALGNTALNTPATDHPKVACQVDPTDNTRITVIYVCWDQSY